MRNLTITALLLLSCCARFDEAKEREGCQKAHPNDQVAADKCFETSILEWEKAHAWVARITHRRPETPQGTSPNQLAADPHPNTHTGPLNFFGARSRPSALVGQDCKGGDRATGALLAFTLPQEGR
jgi:hypothetical protein